MDAQIVSPKLSLLFHKHQVQTQTGILPQLSLELPINTEEGKKSFQWDYWPSNALLLLRYHVDPLVARAVWRTSAWLFAYTLE